jgi:SHS2 domain-containing protein
MVEVPFLPFEQVEHTADLAYLVRGRSLEELFENAALGMFSFLTDPATVEEREEERIQAAGSDDEECLVTWLQELLYRYEVRHRLYRWFRVLRAGVPEVRALAWGEEVDPRRHPVFRDIKAATYHDLRITRSPLQEGGLYQVRIVLDI